MDPMLRREARCLLLVVAFAAAFFAHGPVGLPSPVRAAVYAAGIGAALFLFAREALGDRAALAAAVLTLAAAAPFWPGSVELRRSALLAGSLLFFLAADRSPRTRPHPGLLLGGWLFLGASLLPNGIAATLLVPAALAGHLLLRPAEARKRFLLAPMHLGGILVAAGAVAGFLALAREGAAVEFLPRARRETPPPTVALGALPVALLPLLPLAAAALAWAWRRARRDEAPFARTGLSWVVAAALVTGACAAGGGAGPRLLLLVPAALLVGAWLDLAAEKNPLGSAARWGVGGACAAAAAAGVVFLLHRDRAAFESVMPDGSTVRLGFELPAWGYVAAGALTLAGAAAAAVRLFLLAAPTRAVLDLVLSLSLAALALGLASPY